MTSSAGNSYASTSALGDGDIAAGFDDPTHGAQRSFRAVLDAFAHPGRIVSLTDAPEAPAPLCRATAAFLLTLVDGETPLWLAPDLDRPGVRDFVRFHAGAPIVGGRSDAAFAVLRPDLRHDLSLLFEGFAIGTDAYPDRSATLVIEVAQLGNGPARTWRGPGIDGQSRVSIAGLDDGFWAEWKANQALFPCGVDVVFTAGDQLLALPRGIAVEG